MLPLGRKNARKCSECDITCHANCAHLVPDFCGMSMETANQLLRDMRDINKARGGRTLPPPRQSSRSQQPTGPADMSQMVGAVDRMKLEQQSTVPDGRMPGMPPQAVDPRLQQPSLQMSPSPSQSPQMAPRPMPGRVHPPAYEQPPPGAGALNVRPGYDHPADGYVVCLPLNRDATC